MDRIVSYDDIINVKSTPGVTLIDVREEKEIKETGLIPGSINIPTGQVENDLTKLDDKAFQDKYHVERPKKDSTIWFTCRSGRRAEKAMEDLDKLGFTSVKYYAGSWLEWESRQEP